MFPYFMDTSSEKFRVSMHGAKYDTTMAQCIFFCWHGALSQGPLHNQDFLKRRWCCCCRAWVKHSCAKWVEHEGLQSKCRVDRAKGCLKKKSEKIKANYRIYRLEFWGLFQVSLSAHQRQSPRSTSTWFCRILSLLQNIMTHRAHLKLKLWNSAVLLAPDIGGGSVSHYISQISHSLDTFFLVVFFFPELNSSVACMVWWTWRK